MGKNKSKSTTNKLKHTTLFVKGMHCASCEVLIERKLLKQENIEGVDASLKGNRVEVDYVGQNQPDLDQLNEQFNELGYKFSYKKFKQKPEQPLLSIKNGSLQFSPTKLKQTLRIFLVALVLIVGFFAFESLQLGQYVSVDSNSSLPAFFTLGVVAGLSSCAALIGGLLLSMIKQWNEVYIDADTKLEKAQPHIMFHIGRVVSFLLLGGVLGLVGEAISLNNAAVFAILTVVVSIVMFVLAMQMLGVSWAQEFKLTAPKSLTRFAANEENFQGKYMPLLIGALTFFLPCGFTLIAQTVALTSGSFLQGALIMLFFALGTLPTLVGISFGGLAFNSKPHLTAKFNLIAGLVIVFFVIYNINGQMNVLGLPSLSDVSISFESKTEDTVVQTDDSGRQILNITAQGFEYVPTSSMTIKSGIPTTLVVDNKGIQGCGSFMAAYGLIDNFVALKTGVNEIDLGSPSPGTYKLTCSMGMVRPVTITVI